MAVALWAGEAQCQLGGGQRRRACGIGCGVDVSEGIAGVLLFHNEDAKSQFYWYPVMPRKVERSFVIVRSGSRRECAVGVVW